MCADSDPLSVLEHLDNHLAKQGVMLGEHLAGMVVHSSATSHSSVVCHQENALCVILHSTREKDSRSEMSTELQEQQPSECEAEQTAQMEHTKVLMEVDAMTTELWRSRQLTARHYGIQHDAVQRRPRKNDCRLPSTHRPDARCTTTRIRAAPPS